MEITAKMVKELREMTGAGMMDCKKALQETEGVIEKAIDLLREKGMAKAVKKAGRVAAEGVVFEGVSEDNKTAVLIEFNAETDFVSKNAEFKDFGKLLVETTLKNKEVTNIDELKAVVVEGTSIADRLVALIAKIGENMNIRRMEKVTTVDGFVTTYDHLGGKLGVIVKMSGEVTEENLAKAKGIAMHVAAMNPTYLNSSEVTVEILEHEKEIARKQLELEGKPAKIIENILVGKMKKYYEENCLVNQIYVKAEDKETVEKFAGDIEVQAFTRFKLGDGIEKKEEDFAAEVAAQIKG